ncbi:hypothetical protein ACP70R_005655 [Stipagrostis hirtigluma subsp. patula]
MAPELRMISLAVAALLLFASPQTRGWEAEDDRAVADMVPVQTPAERVLVAMPGGGAGAMAAPTCLQCRCCSKSSPGSCQMTTCCSTFNCDVAGKCSLVQQTCGCSGCGGRN